MHSHTQGAERREMQDPTHQNHTLRRGWWMQVWGMQGVEGLGFGLVL